jgi:ABC-2 type transport system ATP-binding protein
MGFTKLDTLAEKPIDGLSKGMKQRLCLGRAMIHNPAVMILDEPAAGLDPRARIQLREMIRELAADGKAILISSHILTELAEMCDLVGIIEQGRLLAVGNVAEIQRGHETQQSTPVQARILGGAERASHWLAARQDIQEIRADGELIAFEHRGDREAEVQLLRELIEAGFPVLAFGSQTRSLEEVFMQVTRGHVQ